MARISNGIALSTFWFVHSVRARTKLVANAHIVPFKGQLYTVPVKRLEVS